jgi:segregation and condensation protein B
MKKSGSHNTGRVQMFDNAQLDRIVFALLFASDEPLSAARIAKVLEEPATEVKAALLRVAEYLEAERSSSMLEQVALGYQLATRPEYSKYIARLYSGKRKHRLSRAGLETLAIIAYKQPITRAEIENIRGVSCGGVISTLMERSLIRIVGKAKILGGPFLYGTTHEFLEYLGLNDLNDLPGLEELEALLEKEEYGEEPAIDIERPEQDAVESMQGDMETADDATAPEQDTVESTDDATELPHDTVESLDDAAELPHDTVESTDIELVTMEDATAPRESPAQEDPPPYTQVTHDEFNRQPEETNNISEEEIPDEEKKYSE